MATLNSFLVTGNLVDISNRTIYLAEIIVENGRIKSIRDLGEATHHSPLTTPDSRLTTHGFILPGFVDSHVHIESSMLIPSEFAKLAVVHGTVATVSDPHEIANVCGIEGVNYMIENGNTVPFKFNFGAPSCVPATIFETAGAALDSIAVKKLLERPEIKYLSEMMNFPGVLSQDEEVLKKIEAAHLLDKPVDGHAPGLRGELAKQYIEAGISTDHECFTEQEALDKLQHGMKILIREGSAAKNFEALADLLHEHSSQMMLCSDDKHPDSLVAGHINQLCARAVAKGIDVFNVLQAACVNPVQHYKLDVGILRVADPADFIVVEDLTNFRVVQTYIGGQLVAEDGVSLMEKVKRQPPILKESDVFVTRFDCDLIAVSQLKIGVGDYPSVDGKIPVIEALDGQLITNKLMLEGKITGDEYVSDKDNDILKMVVVNRYFNAPVAKCFIKNFGFKYGAIASSVAHDSHNIVAVGVDDQSLEKAINLIIKERGGISAVDDSHRQVLALPVAGLMSADDGYQVAKAYTEMDAMAKSFGSKLSAPFMTLSFMALLVIPHLKLSDKGLFDGDRFEFI
ncbi:MAG: adenine deaminase [Bacteroidota bacterium]